MQVGKVINSEYLNYNGYAGCAGTLIFTIELETSNKMLKTIDLTEDELTKAILKNEIYITNMCIHNENVGIKNVINTPYLDKNSGSDELITCEERRNEKLISYFNTSTMINQSLAECFKIRYTDDGKYSQLDTTDIVLAGTEYLAIPPVNEIKSYAFSDNTNIKTVGMDDSLQFICERAFVNTVNLKQVSIGKGLKYIGNDAFTNSGVEEITIKSDNYNIGERAFFSTTKLNTINSLEGARLIDNYALGNGINTIRIKDCEIFNHELKNTRHLYVTGNSKIRGNIQLNNCILHISEEIYNLYKNMFKGVYIVQLDCN